MMKWFQQERDETSQKTGQFSADKGVALTEVGN
jgi:hypothetical protein